MGDSNIRRERFKRIAPKRVENLIKDIRTLSNCSNTGNYEYTKEEVDKMIKAIRDEIKIMELLFKKNLDKNKKDTFKF